MFKSVSICLLTIAVFSQIASSAEGQVKIESIQIPASLRDRPQSDQDQYRVETAIKVAAEAAKKQNRNVTVFFSTGKLIRNSKNSSQESTTNSGYEFNPKIYRLKRPILVPGGVVLAGEGLGRREARLVWEKCESNSALLIFRNGFGGGLRNLDIRLGPKLESKTNVTGIYLHSQSSAVFKDFAIDMSVVGADSNGMVIARNKTNNESLKIQNFNIRAARPVIVMSGDNLIFENFDCLCSSPVSSNGISAIFQNWNGNVPANWTIGPGSGQKGDHAIALTGISEKTGDALTIIGFRWEQGTSKGPAWLFDIDRRSKKNDRLHFAESITMINCRNGRQAGSPDYVSVLLPGNSFGNVNIIGGYLPGKMEIGKGRRKNNTHVNTGLGKR